MKTIDFLSGIKYNKKVIIVGQKVGAYVGKNWKTKIRSSKKY